MRFSFRVVQCVLHSAHKTALQQTNFHRVIASSARYPGNFLNQTIFIRFCSSSKMAPAKSEKFEHLPKIAKPFHYKIHLKTFLEKFTFEGNETIELEILKPTNVLKFYSSQIEFKDVSLKIGNETLSKLPVEFNERWETATVTLPKEIEPGKVSLDIKFEGVLNDKMKGFYRSKYKNAEGNDEYMATTQFESTFARKAFPCWDEPTYKATFDVELTVPKNKVALSNMKELSETPAEDGWKTVKYATTPVMSTYLLAFIVGDFEYVEGNTKDNVRVRIYTLPGKKYQGNFALEVSLKALPFYGDFFGIPYGLPKCDLIAIPDFNFGAMENWGLVTYREVYLLLDPKASSTTAKENIALVVGHELAHMWFGNLTTMEWWTDLWLKEGYATWMEHYFVNDAFPSFDIWTQFVNFEAMRAMSLDALKSSHPIEVPINDPDEVEEIYDAVSYSKSASVIRMLHDYLGDATFRKGLKNYLAKYSFKNAVTQNLWDCLSEVSGKNVSELMNNWTKFMGFPVIKVSTSEQNGKVVLNLEQERFIADGSKDEEGPVWHVPISIATASSPDKPATKILLTKKSTSIPLDNVKPGEWLKLNAGFTGFYKVRYSDEMLKQLLTPISKKVLKAHDRLNICGDVFAMVRAGQMSATLFLDLLESYADETDFTVWSEIDASLATLDNCLERTDYYEKYQKFIRQLYEKIGDQLGWDPKPNEGHTESMLRPLVLGRLGRAGDQKVIDVARKHFRSYVDEGKDLLPDLRGMVFGLVGKYDGEKAQETLIEIFEKSDFSEVQRQCLTALAKSSDVKLQQKSLDYAFSSDKVRLQDSYMVVFGVTSSVSGQETAWEYFKKNMDKLIEKFGSPTSGLFSAVLKMTARCHCTEEKAKDVEEYFKAKKDLSAGLDRPIQQSLENIHLNIGLLKRDKDAIKAWLIKKGY